MQASSPTWVCNYARAAVSRLAAGLAMDRRGGFHIRPRDLCAAVRSGGMRASRPTFARMAAALLFGRALAAVCRGGPWPSRKPCAARKHPGTMQASSPYMGLQSCKGRGFPFGRGPCHGVVGADSISARGTPRRRKVRRDGASRPTSARMAAAIRVGPKHKNLFVGAGFIPPAEPRAATRPPGMMQASSPTWVCNHARAVVSRLAAALPWIVGADSISARGTSAPPQGPAG